MTTLPGLRTPLINRRRLAILTGLLLIGITLRLIGITASSLWFDEVFSRNVATQTTLTSIVYDGVAGDVHPPLYFVLLDIWVALTGDNALSLRLLSALLAILTLPAIYHLARRLFGGRAASVALLLTVLSPLQIYYAQEARQYMLSVLCAAWIGVGLLGLTQRRRFGTVVYVVAAVAGLYTHYFIGLLLAALHLWLILYSPARREWRRWLLADLLITIAFLPQVAIFLGQTQAVLDGFWITPPNPAAPLVTLAFLLLGATLPLRIAYLAVAVIGSALAVGYLDMRRVASPVRAGWWLCLIAVLLPMLIALIVSFVRSPIYLDRSFTLLSPFLLLLLAAGIAYARRPSLAPVIGVLLIAIFIGTDAYSALTPDPAKPPYQQAVAQIMAQPDALLAPVIHLHDSSYLPMTYYGPVLSQKLLNIGSTSWLFPKTWQIFGVQRWTDAQLLGWWQTYDGTARIVIAAQVSRHALELFDQMRLSACQVSDVAYPDSSAPQLVIYTVTHGTCYAFDLQRYRRALLPIP